MGDNKRVNRSNVQDLITISRLLTDGDIEKAGKYLKDYQDKYPDSKHFVYLTVYARFLGYLDKKDMAIDVFMECLRQNKKSNNVNETIYYLVILLLKQGRYDEAYYYCNMIEYREFETKPTRFTINSIRTLNYLKKELGLDSDVYDINTYSMIQMYYYSDYIALGHIYEKHNIDTRTDNDGLQYSFNMDYEDFERLYFTISLALLCAEETFEYVYGDAYYFRIKDIGINLLDGSYTDVLKVITNNNSFEILSMFPVWDQKNSNRVINEIITEPIIEYHSTKKKRVVSQIDKFNNKYNIGR